MVLVNFWRYPDPYQRFLIRIRIRIRIRPNDTDPTGSGSGSETLPISLEPDRVNPLIDQTLIIESSIIHRLKYLRSTTLGCKNIGIRKSEFVAKKSIAFFLN